jgi:hypothetical protein
MLHGMERMQARKQDRSNASTQECRHASKIGHAGSYGVRITSAGKDIAIQSCVM